MSSSKKSPSTVNHRSRRLLKMLGEKRAFLETSSSENIYLLVLSGERSIKCQKSIVADWLQRGYVYIDAQNKGRAAHAISITAAGIDYLARTENGNCADQHRRFESQTIEVSGISQIALRNINESPLSALFSCKKSQKRWLDSDQFNAGERLRSDFEFSQMTPSITASWDPTTSLNRKGGGRVPEDNLTDRVIGAQQRLRQAIEAVGPEFSAILLDICCFLKGMEQVERERQWPRRSAKLLLRAALSALSRHYCPGAKTAGRSNIKHWATENYRPKI